MAPPRGSLLCHPASFYLLVGATVTSLYLLWKEKQKKQSQADSNNNKECIYLDYNATTPIAPHVVDAMMPYLTMHFGNPGSSHVYGQAPRQAVQRARRQILKLLASDADDALPEDCIWFTSCGTESDNLAIQIALQSTQHWFAAAEQGGDPSTKPHIVTSNVEHPAVEAYLKKLEQVDRSCAVTYVPVQTDGRVLASDVIAAIRNGDGEDGSKKTVLVTLMYANNETGALQPVKQVAEYCRKDGILFHTDAAQAVGKVSLDLTTALGQADMVSIVGHKMGAPKGIACLYVRPDCWHEQGRRLPEGQNVLLVGGGQEFGRRGGTENVPYIVGLGAAAERAAAEWKANAAHMEALRARLWNQLERQMPVPLHVHGPIHPQHRLPNTLSVGLQGVHSGKLLAAVRAQVAASAGATCHSAEQAEDDISSVLRAMQIPPAVARGTLRLSMGPHSTADEMDRAARLLAQHVQRQIIAEPPQKSH